MPPPLLVIVLGLPGAGKTTLGRRLAAELRLPFFYRDGLKEVLYDSLGWQDRAETKRYGPASYELLYYAAETSWRSIEPSTAQPPSGAG